LFSAILFAMSIALIEFACFTIWMIFPPLPVQDLSAVMKLVAESGRDRQSNREALHPYMGWVFDPDIAGAATSLDQQIAVNELGFIDSETSIRKRRPDQFIIGILGGSVAQQVSFYGEAAFRQRLSACPELQGKEVEIVRLAMAGYKQPQQLMAFNYVSVLGGEFDLVVNIDGYNEMALAVSENDPGDVFLAYPRAWDARLQDVVDPRTTSLSFRLIQIRATRQEWAQLMSHIPIGNSWTMSLVWAERDQSLTRQLIELGMELRTYRERKGYGFVRSGPKQMYSTKEEMFDHAVMIWRNSSLQLHHQCAGRGIAYIHVLQPNQYHTGSKVLTEVEQKNFYSPDDYHSRAIQRGYPLMIAGGETLRAAGVSFQNLTNLFSDVSETVYADYFCHYNQHGNDLFAEAIAGKIAAELSRGDRSNQHRGQD
jgi:hypothetical protein